MEEAPKLTLRQRRFIDAYIGEARGNATEAARMAGYTDPRHAGFENRTKPYISEEISRVLAERTLTGEQVLDRLSEHANGTLAHFIHTKGDVAVLDLSTEQAKKNLHLLKKIKMKRRTGGGEKDPWEEIETEIELHDPQAALVHIGRHHKLFTDKAELTGKDGAALAVIGYEVVIPSVERPGGTDGGKDPV